MAFAEVVNHDVHAPLVFGLCLDVEIARPIDDGLEVEQKYVSCDMDALSVRMCMLLPPACHAYGNVGPSLR